MGARCRMVAGGGEGGEEPGPEPASGYQVHVHVAETSGQNRDVLGPHVDVLVYLTLLASEACACHVSHIRGGTFPYEPGENEPLGGPRARVGNAMDCVKYLLFEGGRYNRPENPSADVSQEGVALHVLCAEVQARLGT